MNQIHFHHKFELIEFKIMSIDQLRFNIVDIMKKC